jgi:beta-N-acetylhexosaminidase
MFKKNVQLDSFPFNLNPTQIQWVEETRDKMTLKEKVGQLFILNIHTGSKKDLDDILSYQPAGVFLQLRFKGQQHKISSYLQSKAKIPLLIAGDLELGGLGGAINGTPFSTQMGVAATNDNEMAFKFGKVVGTEGRAMGYNVCYSPVVDVNKNFRNPLVNLRAFSDDPEKVLRMSKAFIRGLNDTGVYPTAKHFPGDGIDDRNQHYVTTHNWLSVSEWEATSGKIYQELIRDGILSIMAAHIDFPAWSRKLNPQIKDYEILPASLSADLNIKLLREHLNFNGVIVSDATGMVGFTSQGPREALVPMVINSGVDIFLFAHGRKEDFAIMLKAAESGLIPKDRIDEAITRILAMKVAMHLLELKQNGTLVPLKSQLKEVGKKEHNIWARECAQKSITLVKDTQNILPISKKKHKRILLIRSGDYSFATWKFRKFLGKKGFKVKEYKKGAKINKQKYDLMIFLVCEPGFYDKNSVQLDFRKLMGMHWWNEEIPTIFISIGSPYHLYDVPRMKTFINAYSPFPFVLETIVECLVGERVFQGISPVDPFCGLFDAHF